ncbi:pyridoxamine 5'-phosphate oxidase family protein [Leisingera aquimarina]|uniref:pyridoxamine 5'-phosphate oxidase family protein n=1 Tax=Leisingera aquimarina TaxID=476529 RepID=UPI001B7F9B62
MQHHDVEAAAWQNLEDAADDPRSGYRYLTLCSVNADLAPQARTVVLRCVDCSFRVLEFHTDIRSPKWAELTSNPQASVLGYCPETRTQLRLFGRITLFPSGTDRAEQAWQTLPPWTRGTYSGGPPGDERAFEARPENVVHSGNVGGNQAFGVASFERHPWTGSNCKGRTTGAPSSVMTKPARLFPAGGSIRKYLHAQSLIRWVKAAPVS